MSFLLVTQNEFDITGSYAGKWFKLKCNLHNGYGNNVFMLFDDHLKRDAEYDDYDKVGFPSSTPLLRGHLPQITHSPQRLKGSR